jgi:ATP-binding cassette subfamily C protein
MANSSNDEQNKFIKEIIKKAQPILLVIFGFSCVVNLFMLISPLYSLQVLDRVLSSQSLETLLSLSLLMLVMYIALMMLQTAKSFALIKLGEWLDKEVSPMIFKVSIRETVTNSSASSISNNLRDFQVIKSFLTGQAINSFLDAPWSIIYIIVLFWIHPWMGWLSIIGIILILISALVNTLAINSTLLKSNEENIKGLNNSEVASRNAEVIEAMGMMKYIITNWSGYNNAALDLQSIASYRNGIISNFSRYMIRMVLQLLVTGLGAYLVITRPDEMTTGGMIASSIILGRALTPFDAAIEMWRQISGFNI